MILSRQESSTGWRTSFGYLCRFSPLAEHSWLRASFLPAQLHSYMEPSTQMCLAVALMLGCHHDGILSSFISEFVLCKEDWWNSEACDWAETCPVSTSAVPWHLFAASWLWGSVMSAEFCHDRGNSSILKGILFVCAFHTDAVLLWKVTSCPE